MLCRCRSGAWGLFQQEVFGNNTAHVIRTVYWKHVKCKMSLTASNATKMPSCPLFQSTALQERLTLMTNRLNLLDVQHCSFALRMTQLKSYSCDQSSCHRGTVGSRCKVLSSFVVVVFFFHLGVYTCFHNTLQPHIEFTELYRINTSNKILGFAVYLSST